MRGKISRGGCGSDEMGAFREVRVRFEAGGVGGTGGVEAADGASTGQRDM